MQSNALLNMLRTLRIIIVRARGWKLVATYRALILFGNLTSGSRWLCPLRLEGRRYRGICGLPKRAGACE